MVIKISFKIRTLKTVQENGWLKKFNRKYKSHVDRLLASVTFYRQKLNINFILSKTIRQTWDNLEINARILIYILSNVKMWFVTAFPYTKISQDILVSTRKSSQMYLKVTQLTNF